MKVIKPLVPLEYLSKMGEHSIQMNGFNLAVKVIDDLTFVDQNIRRLVSVIQIPKVICFDAKLATFCDDGLSRDDHNVIVACCSEFCLIVHVGREIDETVNLLKQKLTYYSSDLCFVTPLLDELPIEMHMQQLAARVLKRPSFCRCSFAEICNEVGVEYQGSATGKIESVPVESMCPTILSEEQVKVVIADAYACQQVGVKLLASL